ncbi:MAG: glucose 1-dehydrogenase, partial [Phycisphaerae bacterium]|nr:glucose 1-dehydrogenase [Phycisphaerae bacterium]
MNTGERLAGKKTLVTGSGTGIGREIALEFARQGADVVLHYAHSAAGAESAVEEIRAMGRQAEVFQADFNQVEEVVELARQAVNFLGAVDCLVNNSGITFNRPFIEVTPEQFDVLYHVNIRAQFFLTQEIVKGMVARKGGAVCNLTSIHGLQGVPEHSVYAGTKGAIIAHTRALAVELAHQGVRVNAIAPGWVTVDNHYKAVPGSNAETAHAAAHDAVPAARAGVPLDIAKLAAFLCCGDADFIVGQTLVADGGTTSLMSLFPDFRAQSTARFGKG